jgi:excisionase family DNA binding protein
MKTKIVESELCSQLVAACKLGVSLSTIKRMVRDKELRAVTIHRRVMISVAELNKIITGRPDVVAEAADDLARVRMRTRRDTRATPRSV